MEIVIGIIAVILVLAFIEEFFNKLNNWSKEISWVKFLSFLIIGSILLAVLFSFTSEGVLVIVGAYIFLLLIALFYGSFKQKNNYQYENELEKIRFDIAKNLIDKLDDETIAETTELSIDDVKSLKSKHTKL